MCRSLPAGCVGWGRGGRLSSSSAMRPPRWLFVPGSLLTLAAGAIVGIVFGVAYVFLGAMLATVAVTAVVTRLARRSLQEATE